MKTYGRRRSKLNMVTLNIKWYFSGLTNTLVNFQEYINKILTDKLNIFVIICLDNIFIYIDNNKNGHVIAI